MESREQLKERTLAKSMYICRICGMKAEWKLTVDCGEYGEDEYYCDKHVKENLISGMLYKIGGSI